MQTDLLLINPGNKLKVYQGLASDLAAIETPSFTLLVAEYIRRCGFSVDFIDIPAGIDDEDTVANRVSEINPKLVGVFVYGYQPSASTQNMYSANLLCKAIKEKDPNIKIMISGTHPSALPEKTLREEHVDYVCDRDGFNTTELLLKYLNSEVKIEDVPSLWYWDKDNLLPQIKHNSPSTLMTSEELSQKVPIPAWDLIDFKNYRSCNWHSFGHIKDRSPYASIYTSLGCPFSCEFCLDENTKIIVSNGKNKKIKDITKEDKLVAFDTETNKVVETNIVEIASRKVNEISKITLTDGKEILATDEHPFYIEGKWIEAKDLKVGDKVLVMELAGNCPHNVSIYSIEKIEGERQVYNFQCAPYDNYFAEYILTHNCCINSPFGKPSYRLWHPDVIIEQLDMLRNKHGVKNIKFVDEMFVLNESHVLGICDRIIERKLDLNIWAYARVDTVKDKFLEKLKLAGFNWLALGIESSSKHVRDGANKIYTNEDIFDVVKRIQSHGINVIGNYMFGMPDDTLETMQNTLDMAIELNTEFANFYSTMAYPGSQLYKMAIENNWELPSSWIEYSQHSYETFPLRTDTLTNKEVLKFRDYAFIQYFSGKKYQDMIMSKFGENELQEIKNMLSINLKRKILED